MENIQRALDLAAKQGSTQPHARLHSQLHTEDPAAAERSAVRREFATAPIEPATRLAVDWAGLRDSRIVDRDDTRPAAHAYRMLRTQVLQRARAHGISTIGVVSAVNGEGKTLTAINLALSLAADPNQSVLLIDLDLRRPSIAKTLRLPVERGLEAWFAGTATVEELWHGVEGVDRLFLLPTLVPVPASSEALARATTKKLLQDLKDRDPGRILIVDLPPVLLSDDALTLAPHLDAVVLVVAEGRTQREDVARVLELLGNTRVIGTVLNRSTESEMRAY
jgi:protein-tyrosine kinase